MNDPLLIEGGCHCRALRYELSWPALVGQDGRAEIPARRCSCSFCTRIDGVWTSHPDARLKFAEDPDHPATPYRFGTKTADFLFCSECGITPLAVCEVDGRRYAVVNVNTFDENDGSAYRLSFSDSCFNGESVGDRLSRRKGRWISRLEWVSASAQASSGSGFA